MTQMHRQTLNLPQDVFSALNELPEGLRAETVRKLLTDYVEGRVEVTPEKEDYKAFGFYAEHDLLEKAKAKAKAGGSNFTKVAVELLRIWGRTQCR